MSHKTDTGWREIVVYRGVRIEVRSDDTGTDPPAYLKEVVRGWAARVVSASHKRSDLDALAAQLEIDPTGTKADLIARITGT